MLKSEGAVRNHQADTLGVYRMVDSYNDRPVYKQDGGENYIYYRYFFGGFIRLACIGAQYFGRNKMELDKKLERKSEIG